ncbi:MAG: hypothetical protein A2Y33_10040 [Spirochaetes bacterium GWF1_51_8]|nr:MAG: hypothetical protein A2Y33_10040 [Spirochaetes bacterium GWF1_51_8]
MRGILIAICFLLKSLSIVYPDVTVPYLKYTDFHGHFSTVFPLWNFRQGIFSNDNLIFKAGFFREVPKEKSPLDALPCFLIRFDPATNFDEKTFAVELAQNKNPLLRAKVCQNAVEAFYYLFGGLNSDDSVTFSKTVALPGIVYASMEQIVIRKSIQYFRIEGIMIDVFAIDAGFPSKGGMAWVRTLVPVTELTKEISLMYGAVARADLSNSVAPWSGFLLSGSLIKNIFMTWLSLRFGKGYAYSPDEKPKPPSIISYALGGLLFAAFIFIFEKVALFLARRRWKNDYLHNKAKPEIPDPKYPFLPAVYRMVKFNSYHRDLIVSILFIYGAYFFIASFIDWMNQGEFASFGLAVFIAGLLYLVLGVKKVVLDLIWGLMEVYLWGIWEIRFTVKGIYGRTLADIVTGKSLTYLCDYEKLEAIKEKSFLLTATYDEDKKFVYTHDPMHTEEIETGQRTFYSDIDSVIGTMMER